MYSSSYYNQLIDEETKQLNIYTEYKTELEDIISEIEGSFIEDVDDINSYMTKCKDNGVDGIRHDSVVSQNIEDIVEAKEKSPEVDSNLSSTKSNISNELYSVNSKITESLNRISSLETLRDQASEEERRQEEEELKLKQEAIVEAAKNMIFK